MSLNQCPRCKTTSTRPEWDWETCPNCCAPLAEKDIAFQFSDLSVTDWFAGQVAAALVTTPLGLDDALPESLIACAAYDVADALMAERKRRAE